MVAVEPNRESLLHQLHERRKVPHLRQMAAAPVLRLGSVDGQLLLNDLQPSGLIAGRPRIEHRVPAQQFRVGDHGLLRHAHQHVEMVREDDIGEDLEAAVIGHLPELAPQDLLGLSVEQPVPSHGAAPGLQQW